MNVMPDMFQPWLSRQRFRLLQLRREAPILLLEFFQPRIDGHRFASAFLRRQSAFALLAPGDHAIDENGRPSFQALQHRASERHAVVYYHCEG
jgi:hypothetical protein